MLNIALKEKTLNYSMYGCTVKQVIFAITFSKDLFLRFLLLLYRKSIKQRNICVFNFYGRPKSLKNAKIRRMQKLPVLHQKF